MRMFIAAAVALTAVSAHADWEKTRWGMTPDEVKATDQTLTPADSRASRAGLNAILAGRYIAGGFSFDSDFQFDAANHLAMVGLNLTDLSLCHDLAATLQAKYGEPITNDAGRGSGRTVWNDGKNGNVVVLNAVPGIACTIAYKPLDTKAMKGL